MGAWIETIPLEGEIVEEHAVAPRVGAWIETLGISGTILLYIVSHPVWVRGLKLLARYIQIVYVLCRTPCGCVD